MPRENRIFQLDTGPLEVLAVEVVQLHPAIVRLETEELALQAGLPTGAILVLNRDQKVWHRVERLDRGLVVALHQFGTYGVKDLKDTDGTVMRLKAVLNKFPWLVFMALNPLDYKGVGRDWRKIDAAFEELLQLIGRRRNELEQAAYTFTGVARDLCETEEGGRQQLWQAESAVQTRVWQIVDEITPRLDTRRLVLLTRMSLQMQRVNSVQRQMRAMDERWGKAGPPGRAAMIAEIHMACLAFESELSAKHLSDLPFRHLGKNTRRDLAFCRENLAKDARKAMRRFAVAWRALHSYHYFMRMVAAREQLTLARYVRGWRREQHVDRAKVQLAELEQQLGQAVGLDGYLEGTRSIGNARRQVSMARHFVEAPQPKLEKACGCLDLGMARF